MTPRVPSPFELFFGLPPRDAAQATPTRTVAISAKPHNDLLARNSPPPSEIRVLRRIGQTSHQHRPRLTLQRHPCVQAQIDDSNMSFKFGHKGVACANQYSCPS